MLSIERRGEWIVARVRVRSDSDPHKYYSVLLERRIGSRWWRGWCECPDFRYRGEPCKHIVRAKAAVHALLARRLARHA